MEGFDVVLGIYEGEGFRGVGFFERSGEFSGFFRVVFYFESLKLAVGSDEKVDFGVVEGAPEIELVFREFFLELRGDVVFEKLARVGA